MTTSDDAALDRRGGARQRERRRSRSSTPRRPLSFGPDFARRGRVEGRRHDGPVEGFHAQGSNFGPGAENLANYLALRHHDLSELQPCLSVYGLSSLGRSEARVRTALDTLLATLARVSELDKPEYPPLQLVSDGARALRGGTGSYLGA